MGSLEDWNRYFSQDLKQWMNVNKNDITNYQTQALTGRIHKVGRTPDSRKENDVSYVILRCPDLWYTRVKRYTLVILPRSVLDMINGMMEIRKGWEKSAGLVS